MARPAFAVICSYGRQSFSDLQLPAIAPPPLRRSYPASAEAFDLKKGGSPLPPLPLSPWLVNDLAWGFSFPRYVSPDPSPCPLVLLSLLSDATRSSRMSRDCFSRNSAWSSPGPQVRLSSRLLIACIVKAFGWSAAASSGDGSPPFSSSSLVLVMGLKVLGRPVGSQPRACGWVGRGD